ncbi:MAG: hypothetical protein NPIRA04_18050 [Nitrospirales bacterium]|nr:MAG: hypothetical protein NPIRA04_18050 [Nitrospirales bacterium]
MITINLLPRRPLPMRREAGGLHRSLVLGIVSVLLSGTVCWGWGSSLLEQRDLVRQEKRSKEQMLSSMIANTQNDKKRLEAKGRQSRLMPHAQFLAKDSRRRNLPILILDEISQSLEPLDLWLLALSIEGDDVFIEGKALSHKAVGQFIQSLEESRMFGRLIRMETQPHILHEDHVMQKFSLQFTTQGLAL